MYKNTGKRGLEAWSYLVAEDKFPVIPTHYFLCSWWTWYCGGLHLNTSLLDAPSQVWETTDKRQYEPQGDIILYIKKAIRIGSPGKQQQ